MVETITPVVHGRRSSYILSITLHAIAATITAGATGALLGLVGMLLGAPWSTAGFVGLVAVALLYAVREAARLPIPLPNARRQVPEWWRTFFSPPVAATLYGAGLGVAFLTFLSFGTFVAVAAGAVVSGDPLLGALICAPFGLARAIAVALVGMGSRDPGSTVTEIARIGSGTVPRAINALALAIVGVTALVSAL
jgi:hypothetical protein